ncbi:MAG: TetR/AcrR family transcriptional regulator [Methyloligellaceae bacterium]
MPYSPEHKAQTRARIVVGARKLFNRRGFAEVSIDEIMGEAGLTRGGFYNHFRNKDELYAEAVGQILTCHSSGKSDDVDIDFQAEPKVLARQIIAAYLSERHFSDIDGSCPLIALPSDVARGGEAVKQAYRQVLNAMIGLFEQSQKSRTDARSRAVTMATMCIGGMVLARAVDDTALGGEIRDVALNCALETGGWDAEAPAVAAE